MRMRQHPQIKRDNSFIPREGTERFEIEPVFGMFDGCDIDEHETWYPQANIDIKRRTIQTNFLDHTFVEFKWPISSPKNSWTNNPAAILRASKEIDRISVSAGLSPLKTWRRSSIVTDSRISPTRLAMNTRNLSLEFSNCKTVVLPVHVWTWLILTVSAFSISSFSRVAGRAAVFRFCANSRIASRMQDSTAQKRSNKWSSIWSTGSVKISGK